MIYFEFGFELVRKVIDRMVGVLGRCRLVLRSGISIYPTYYLMRSKSMVGGGIARLDLLNSSSLLSDDLILSRSSPFRSPIPADISQSSLSTVL